MTRLVIVGPALVVLGYFPARLVTQSRVWCLIAAPITAALLTASVGTIGVLLRVPAAFIPCVTILLSAMAAVPIVRDSLHNRARKSHESHVPLLLPLAGVLPFLTVLRAPIAWDARSIWWFHARWFAEGGAAVWHAMQNPSFAFSNPDYPPLAPAMNGALWWLGGTASLKQAQIVTAVLTLSAVATLGFAVWYATRAVLPGWAAAVGAAALVLAAYGTAGSGPGAPAPGTNGYVDVLWSAAFAAGCVFVLAVPREPRALRWGVLCLAVAAMTKNEGLVAVALVVGLALVRYRFKRQAAGWLLCALGPGVAWLLVARLAGAPSEYAGNSRTTDLLHLDDGVLRRFSPALDGVWHQISTIVIVVAVVTALGFLVARVGRRQISATAFPWMWLAWLATTSSVVYAYVVSSYRLEWHLATSVDRTTIASRMVLLAESFLWASAALATLRRANARADRTEPRQAPSGKRHVLIETPAGG